MSLKLKNYSVDREDKHILDNISLEIPAGELHVIMGPNGAGKSTLSNALSGHPDYKESGEFSIDNKNLTNSLAEERAKAGLFVSFQQTIAIPGLSYIQFIKVAKTALTGDKIDPILFYKELVQICEKNNIDSKLLQKNVGDNLSGGERKKLELLQILALKPKYLVLDEIDAGLDVTSVAAITEAIKDYVKLGNGALVITHHPEIAQMFDPNFVHVLVDGKIVKIDDKNIIKDISESGYNKFV